MSERERWIVYPLVFLALGAAIRDKIARAVVTDDLHCKRIFCQDLVAQGNLACHGLSVVDPENEQSVLAALESAELKSLEGNDPPRRLGILKLNNQSVVVVLGIPVSGSTFAIPDPASQTVAPTGAAPPAVVPSSDGPPSESTPPTSDSAPSVSVPSNAAPKKPE